MVTLLVIILVFVILGGGGYQGYRREYYGIGGLGIIGTVLVVLLALALAGGPHYGYCHY